MHTIRERYSAEIIAQYKITVDKNNISIKQKEYKPFYLCFNRTSRFFKVLELKYEYAAEETMKSKYTLK